uniref:Splicing coactivator subunit-like n=1 Tax=Oryza sativa subsp. japonica TaxID=39947 RepID=Q6Z2R4_ORYSJ|nr:splicing coactivator subunit-like [Oryza sativa Japonica Group]
MWKYGSALQQRPELNPYSGRGATSHNWHAPKPHRKQVLGVLKEEESLSVHGGPGARGWRRSAPWVPRVSRTRGRGRLTAGPTWQPRGRAEGGLAGTADGRRTRTRAPMVAAGDQRRGGVAPEREEGRGKRTERSSAHPGRRRRRERRPKRKKTAARLGMTRATVLRRCSGEEEARTESAATRRSGRRCRRVRRKSGAAAAAERSSAATAEREEHGASTNPTARASGERRKRKSEARGSNK